jgi:bifunctional non-homologous end joining protein LigD
LLEKPDHLPRRLVEAPLPVTAGCAAREAGGEEPIAAARVAAAHAEEGTPTHVDAGTPDRYNRCVAPQPVRLSSPERVLFPDEGITKQDLFEYYRAIAPVLVPHLRNRPFTMKRAPYGVTGETYFQKQAPKGMPSWIPTRTFRTHPREGGSRLVDFPLVNSPEALLWMAQMNCIDMNAWYSRVDKPDRPDFVLFDLDPPDGGFALAIRVAHLIREELERVELRSYVKTSGADGIHVLVPIARRATYERTYAFAERVARRLEERHPGLVTTEWLKRKREGVLVDHRQNARGKTIASVYSVRPKPGAPVSTPLRWDELTEEVTPRDFGMREALARVERHGDLFEPVLAGGQALGRALERLR